MVDAATDADLTLMLLIIIKHTPNIHVAGLSTNGATFGTMDILRCNGILVDGTGQMFLVSSL